MRSVAWGAAFLAAAVATVFLNIRFGAVHLSTGEAISALFGSGAEAQRIIVRDLRLPRVLLAMLVGGGLALAGAVFQAILRNPLAEPYILGVSGGAALATVIVLALGLGVLGSWVLPSAAFAGALFAVVLVFGVATVATRSLDVRVLLLAGVVVGAFFTACIALVLSISEADTVRSAVLWMMGSLAGADWGSLILATVYTVPALLVLVGLARPLNLMAVGEETASYLGTEVDRVKKTGFAVASLLTAAGVAVAGIIGFVGLVVPHGVRIVAGADHRTLLPLSFIAGGVFLALADLLARVVLAPTEIPIGVITALVGVPLFLVLLRRDLAR